MTPRVILRSCVRRMCLLNYEPVSRASLEDESPPMTGGFDKKQGRSLLWGADERVSGGSASACIIGVATITSSSQQHPGVLSHRSGQACLQPGRRTTQRPPYRGGSLDGTHNQEGSALESAETDANSKRGLGRLRLYPKIKNNTVIFVAISDKNMNTTLLTTGKVL